MLWLIVSRDLLLDLLHWCHWHSLVHLLAVQEFQSVDVLSPKVFIGLIVGAMLPYWFSAMTMKSVGSAALKMVEEVRRQFNTIPGLMEGTTKPDYATCVKISTDASIKEMIPPGALVMLTPLIVGTFFGVETLSGILAGSLVSGVQVMLIITSQI